MVSPKIYLKAFDTVVSVVYLVLDVGMGLCATALVGAGAGLMSHQPDTQMPVCVDARVPRMTGSSQGSTSWITLRTHITGSIQAENPLARGREPWVAKGAG